MYQRMLAPPQTSFFLFGPRGTGKSTWIRKNFDTAAHYDLLDQQEALRLSKNPHAIHDEIRHLKKKSWVVIDEVQKVPAFLDEVHRHAPACRDW